MNERWLTLRVWFGSILMGHAAWDYYLQQIRDAKDRGAIPNDWPSNRLQKIVKQDKLHPPTRAASPFDDNLPGQCCCCGLGTDLFQFGHWWCAICEGRGHNNATMAAQLGEMHDASEDCKRLWKNYLEDKERGP